MDESVADRWNQRYASSDDDMAALPPPSQVLLQGARWLPANASSVPLRALDLACGRAGNGQWLAEKGFQVSAWDISEHVIEQVQQRRPALIHCVEVRDVIAQPPTASSFDVIVVTRFLERALCPLIAHALTSGGVLFYQTFTHGLSNPDYLLGPNELLELFGTLSILEYHEPEPDASGSAEARLIASRA